MALYELNGSKLKHYPVKDFGKENYEDRIAEILIDNDDLLFSDYPVLCIGKKVRTAFGKEADVLGVDRDGCVVVVELKRGRVEREAVAQVIEYTAWASSLQENELMEMAADFFKKRKRPYDNLVDGLAAVFDIEEEEFPQLNQAQKLVIIGQDIAPEVKDSARFLRRKGLDIYCMRFTYFAPEKGKELLETELEVGGEPTGTGSGAWTNSQWEERKHTAAVVKGAVEALNLHRKGKEKVFITEWGRHQGHNDTWASAYADFVYDEQKMKISSWCAPDHAELYVEPQGKKKGAPALKQLFQGLKKAYGKEVQLDEESPCIWWNEQAFSKDLDLDEKQQEFADITAGVADSIFKLAKSK